MTRRDDKETIDLFEPLMVAEGSPHRGALNDLALDLATRAAAFQSSLPDRVAGAIATLIRSMNCYYSNLIEGHNTHPIDIERALHGDYSGDAAKRDLQFEAKSHIAVQRWIDEGGLAKEPTSPAMIREIHERFCASLPEGLLFVDMPNGAKRIPVVPGEFRERDVKVGQHVAISPGAVPRFLERLNQVYRTQSRIDAILATACAHHRVLWVHPFLDGNGRVARLMSYAMLCDSLNTGGLWSVARGLARNEATYKAHLQACDEPRRGERDGPGTLSEAALASFTEFFLQTCIEQVDFMEGLMRPDRLRDRIMIWAEEEMRGGRLPPKSDAVLRAILYEGEIQRSAVTGILGMSDRTARRVTSALIDAGAVTSESSRAPLVLAFPATLAGRWMPNLFPEQ